MAGNGIANGARAALLAVQGLSLSAGLAAGLAAGPARAQGPVPAQPPAQAAAPRAWRPPPPRRDRPSR